MKTASFTVRADARQSARWKQAAEAEGHPSTGSWLAAAADAYLKVRVKAGLPVPLAWRWGHFSARLDDGELGTVKGLISPPFGTFVGTSAGFSTCSNPHRYTLVYLPDGRILATLRTSRECKALASELARAWFREGAAQSILDNQR